MILSSKMGSFQKAAIFRLYINFKKYHNRTTVKYSLIQWISSHQIEINVSRTQSLSEVGVSVGSGRSDYLKGHEKNLEGGITQGAGYFLIPMFVFICKTGNPIEL